MVHGMPLVWSLCLWHTLRAFGTVSVPLAWSSCLWHSDNDFGMVSNPSPLLICTACILGVFCIYTVFYNFDFGILLQPNQWPWNTPDGPKRCANVWATSHNNGNICYVPPINWFNCLKSRTCKAETQISPEFPKIKKLYPFFYITYMLFL